MPKQHATISEHTTCRGQRSEVLPVFGRNRISKQTYCKFFLAKILKKS